MGTTGLLRMRTVKASLLLNYGIIILSLVGPVVLQDCGGITNLYENSTFSSPRYPNNYNSYSSCEWLITIAEDYTAVVRFQAMRIESCSNCGCDSLSFYDGPDANSPVISKICGSEVPSAIYGSRNIMFVKFVSDGSVAYTGFSARVSKAEIIVQTIESDNGTIQTPNYPNNYEPQKRYVWNVSVPENYQIFLEFLSFELQDSSSCTKDFVEVRDGYMLTGTVLGKFCGTNVQKYLRSSENKVTVIFQSDDSYEARGFFAEFQKAQKCGHTIEGTTGNLSTPNYPNNYGPVERCQWNIIVPEDHHILFRFVTFNIDYSSACDKDYVAIYNGNDTTAYRMGKFCGSERPNVTKSSSSQITVVFQSDASQEAQGFSAVFETDICGEEIIAERGTFHSPNYPYSYSKHEMCSWKVTVPDGYRVALRFDSFRLESSYNCGADSVTVYDGLNKTSNELRKLCGYNTYQKKVYSSGNTLSVRFVTDASYSHTGFSATFIKAPIVISSGNSSSPSVVPCRQDIKSDTGTINSPGYPQWYLPNLECIWNIQVPEGKIIRFEFQSFDVEIQESCSFDYVLILDGNSTNSPHLGHYCGSIDPEPRWTSGNNMVIKFVSDGSFESSGFSGTFTKVDYLEQDITADSGTIESPNYPNNYAPAQKRVWKILVPTGNKILLRFLSFDLEYHQNCTDDFVEVRDGDSSSSNLLGKYCGSSYPPEIRSSAEKLIIIFASDSSEELGGFSAKFEKEAICGADSCRNGGTCARVSRRVFRCSCKHGYEGSLCEQKTLCTNSTCENGGLCFQNGTDGIFQCVCTHGYEGGVCHERILCGNETCRNGGYCTHGGKDGIFFCVCEDGFEGLLCEKTIEKLGGSVVSIVVPVLILLVIAASLIVFFLIRKRLKQQPYDHMKKEESFFDKDETLDS